MIEISNLKKSFGNVTALDGLSFKAAPGAAFGLLGRNGAGKTTCIRILMNIFPPDSGGALIFGKSPGENTKKIGYLPEERGLYPKKTIIDQMVYFGQLRGMRAQRAKKNALLLLERLEAAEYANKKLDTLSKGNQQKIQLAITLLCEPEIIILDEPFSGLDPVNAQILKDIVKEEVKKGCTVIFSSHQMSAVEEFCDEICIIDKGAVRLAGNLRDIKKSYPRDNIYVECENEAADLAAALNDVSWIKKISPKGCGFIVNLNEGREPNSLLGAIINKKIGLSAFYVAEPSLEQIFVEKVGQTHGTV